jgi:hypothetical protein
MAIFRMALLSLAVAACATTPRIKVDDTEVTEAEWVKAVAELGKIASFDLGCEQAQLQMRLFATDIIYPTLYPTRVGVSGCGKRASYVRAQSKWNSGMLPWKAEAISSD